MDSGLVVQNSVADIENKQSVRLDEKGKERKLKDRLAARKRAKKEGRMGNQDDPGGPSGDVDNPADDPASSSTA